MRPRADHHQVRRWQEDVARDPASPSFLPLAEVYTREGRFDVARRLVVRGLAANPENVEAHYLLGRLHRRAGELDQALDEWDSALRLEPDHTPSRRSLGYLHLERREWGAAIRHLEPLARAEPHDERLASALAIARRHATGGSSPAARAVPLEEAVVAPLARFVREARVGLALLVDASGRVVAQHDVSRSFDLASFATLGASVHAASGALASLLGQRRFDQLYQGSGEHQLFLAPLLTPAGELILLCVFGEDTTIGLVRVIFRDFAAALDSLPWSAPAAEAVADAAAFEAGLAAGLGRIPGGAHRPRLLS